MYAEPYDCRHCKTPLRTPLQRASPGQWSADEGSPSPLGVSWLPAQQAYNFAVYSRAAQHVELLFFRDEQFDEPTFSFRFDPYRNKSGFIWHCRIPVTATNDAKYYAYRIRGPEPATDRNWRTSDGEKLLLDPYVRSVLFPPAFDRLAAERPGGNIGKAPLGLLDECQCPFDWHEDRPIRREADLVIYEMHVRGFTRHPSSGLPESLRGTFEGVIAKIPHLAELGITAVELMPVFQFDPQEGNYWGYMPLNFFAPHHAYSVSPDQCGQRSEFRRMVQALHAAGIEVILDVVFNHTCEGNSHGPTYSFKGIDNCTYYLTSSDPHEPYLNFTGCGNTLQTASPAVRRLIVDRPAVLGNGDARRRIPLRSGFCFRVERDGSVNLDDPPIFSEIAGDPSLRMSA